jgi:hypothetical protein
MSSQPPELPPPRISDKSFKMPSVDAYVEPSNKSKRNEESFADFTQFPDSSSKVSASKQVLSDKREKQLTLLFVFLLLAAEIWRVCDNDSIGQSSASPSATFDSNKHCHWTIVILKWLTAACERF